MPTFPSVRFPGPLAALEDQGLLDGATGELLGLGGRPLDRGDDAGPILVAWSDNGPEMTSADTREFMALLAIAQHHGRPSTPTDQAHIESFFGHLKADWPHLETIRDPGALDAELARVRTEYNTVRLHAGIGYVTPADEQPKNAISVVRWCVIGCSGRMTWPPSDTSDTHDACARCAESTGASIPHQGDWVSAPTV